MYANTNSIISGNRNGNIVAGRSDVGAGATVGGGGGRSCIDPYQQQQPYGGANRSVYVTEEYSVQLPERAPQLVLGLNSSFSVAANGQVDLRNLLLAPPAIRTKDGRGSVSAPATPVDEASAVGYSGTGSIFPASPTSSSPFSSAAHASSKSTGLAKFMMLKKVNSSGASSGCISPAPGTSGSAVDGVLKELIHPAHNEALKTHSVLTVKLLKTVSDFAQQLSAIEEQHGEQLQQLVEAFRKRNAELRKERPSGSYALFQVWETLLQEVEVDSQVVTDIANCLSRQVSRPLLDGTFHRKLEARKIFQHREQLENALEKASQQLDKSYQLYDEAYQQHLAAPNTLTLAAYVELHNNYVQDVRAANAMADQFNNVILPQLIQELESVFVDLSKTMTSTIQQGCDAMSERTEGMSKRYTTLANQCRNVNPSTDLATFVRSVIGGTGGSGGTSTGPNALNSFNKFTFIPPRNPVVNAANINMQHEMLNPLLMLKDELVFDRLAGFSLRTKYESLKKDTVEIETHIRQLTDSLESLNRLQQRSLESNLYNKANELQEEICAKKLEWRMAQLHLAAVKAQRDLYGSKAETIMAETGGTLQSSGSRGSKFSISSGSGAGSSGSGGPSGSSGSGIKSKWMKAIRTLTNSSQNQPSPSSSVPSVNPTSVSNSSPLASDMEKGSRLYHAVMAVIALRKSPNSGGGKGERQRATVMPGTSGSLHSVSTTDLAYHAILAEGQRHIFQENTYKKITPCDVCSQVLRGHARQGWKCRLCKINVHADCRNSVGRCLPKSRLLRRQKSSSELEMTNSQHALMLSANNYDPQSSPFEQGLQLAGQLEGDDIRLAGSECDGQSGALANLVNIGEEIDQTYVVLKQASELAAASGTGRRPPALPLVLPPSDQQSSSSPTNPTEIVAGRSGVMRISTYGPSGNQQQPPIRRSNPNALSVGEPASFLASSSAPHSPRRHQKLNLRMKSFSLDESGEHFHHHHHRGHGSGETVMRHHGSHPHVHQPLTGHHRLTHHRSSNPNASMTAGSSGTLNNSQGSSYSQSPSSPVHHGRRVLLSARNTRMNSVELPDDNEKSQSSASASPCPSPKTQRLLPTNLYVVLFNFKGREADELDLKAGYKVTVIDASDPDWWKGKCLGKIGFFPSKYVAKLAPNEKPLQVTHNLQLTDESEADSGRLTKLLRDQIVVQIGEEQNGIVTVRSGDNKQGTCPIQYLQEV